MNKLFRLKVGELESNDFFVGLQFVVVKSNFC